MTDPNSRALIFLLGVCVFQSLFKAQVAPFSLSTIFSGSLPSWSIRVVLLDNFHLLSSTSLNPLKPELD